MDTHSRRPAGTPTGGQFAARTSSAPEVGLDHARPADPTSVADLTSAELGAGGWPIITHAANHFGDTRSLSCPRCGSTSITMSGAALNGRGPQLESNTCGRCGLTEHYYPRSSGIPNRHEVMRQRAADTARRFVAASSIPGGIHPMFDGRVVVQHDGVYIARKVDDHGPGHHEGYRHIGDEWFVPAPAMLDVATGAHPCLGSGSRASTGVARPAGIEECSVCGEHLTVDDSGMLIPHDRQV